MATQTETSREDILATKIAEAVAKATAEATLAVQNKIRPVEIPNGPTVAWNNPTGRTDRPKLTRKTFFCGAPQDERYLSDEEIALFNQVKPGRYHGRQWEVVGREGDGEGDQVIEFRLPVSTRDKLLELPNSLTALLQMILDEQKTRKDGRAE